MQSHILNVKNMVCNRCIKVVKDELQNLGYIVKNIKLGEIEIESHKNDLEIDKIKLKLEENGFELIDNKSAKLIEEIKLIIINKVHHSDEDITGFNFPDHISKTIGKSYSYLSSLFSSVEGITLEKYIINQKIERVKELLVYNELTLSEISYKLGYSSVQYLSNQFKKVTGLNPSHFKKIQSLKRNPIDNLT